MFLRISMPLPQRDWQEGDSLHKLPAWLQWRCLAGACKKDKNDDSGINLGVVISAF